MENIIKLFSDKVALGILHMRIWFNRLENRMRENEYRVKRITIASSSVPAVRLFFTPKKQPAS